MIKNYIKVAFRNLIKYRGYSFINILGLAIGITCCLLILLYMLDELSFDRYNEKYKRTYRVAVYGLLGSNEFNGAVSAAPLAETLLREYPEVEQAVRIQTFGYPVIRYKEKVFSEEKFYWADSTFFDVFTAQFIKGNPRTALTEPNTVAITESMMKKYFGDEDPVGKTINSDKRKDYKVTAVIKDFPLNSHFHFDFIGSLSSYDENEEWLDQNVYTYILLREGVNPKEFRKKLDEVVKKYVAPRITQELGIPFEGLISKGAKYYYYLQPLSDIHLNSNIEHEIEPNSNSIYIYIFSVIAAAILAIACINFMNLTTARSSNRSKEIGIRKTLGSNRPQLIRQFLAETILMSFMAVVISIILIEIFLPSFNRLIDKNLELNYFQKFYTLPLLLFLALIVGIAAGIYPAFYLSSFNPTRIFRKEKIRSTKSWLRNALVISQFSISIILFVGTIVVYTQLQFIMNKDLGYDKDQVLIIQKTDDIAASKESFMEELKNIPGVLSASNSHTIFGKELGSSAYQLADGGERSNNLFWVINSDYSLAETYRIKMAEGRFYSKDFGTDAESIVINQTAADALGLKGDAVGKELLRAGDQSFRKKIIGVMKNFHFESLHQKIKPLVINLGDPDRFGRFVSVRLSPGDYKRKIESLEKLWHKYAGPQAFEYFFFDEEFTNTYRAEERTGTIAAVFSLLAIFIACMGLLGLAAFTTEQRTKEVGIRKIMGAGAGAIVILLSKEFAKWVLIANIIAWPVAYFIMRRWLNDFAYRINIPLWSFIAAGLSALAIALITVSYQAVKAALINPVKSLRYE